MKRHAGNILAIAVILAMVMSFLPARPAGALSTGVVISQVYGGGGNSGGIYTNDFVELFNRGTATVSLAGWSIQYTSASGTGNFGSATNLITPLSGSLAPGQYMLIQEAAGTNVIAVLPTPDITDATPINMSGTGGKVALANIATGLGCNGSSTACTAAQLAQIVDLVGWDGANFFETAAAPATVNATALLRGNGGCTETDNNSADFTAATPAPRNTASPFHYCTGPTNPSGVGAASPNTLFVGDPTLLTVAVSPGSFPTSTGLNVTCDLTSIGGAANQTFFDDGTNGDVTAGDNIFSYATTVASGTTAGAKSLACTISDDQARTVSASIGLTVTVILPIGTVNGPVPDSNSCATHASPYVGQTVTIQGVIYEKTLQAISNSTNTYKGFFIQNTAATADADPTTSDGLFVFMSTASNIGGYTPAVGDEIILTGKVSEYYNMTELVSPLSELRIVHSGVDIDAEIPPVVADPPVSLVDANCYWERLQGMRVQVPTGSVVLGGRNVFSPADAEVWVAAPGSTIAQRANAYARKAYRDAHPLDDNYDPAVWDGNGYRILMGSLGIKSAANDAQALIAPARAYSTVTDAPAGGLNYTFSKYRIEISAQPTFSLGVDPAANNPPGVFDPSIHYSIVDYNLENLYDYRDNPFSGCDFTGDTGCSNTGTPYLAAVTPPYDYVPASDTAYQARLNDIALEIIDNLHSPDILMVQEVENQDICIVDKGALVCGSTDNADGKPDVLQELALKIAANGGPAYDAAFDRDSSDLRGIAPAFLYRTDRVELLPAAGDPILGTTPKIDGYTSVPYDSDVSNPKTLNAVYTGTGACETNWVFPRAPDVGLFRIWSNSTGVGSHRDVYLINNHFKSGPDTCVAHRTEQAKYNAALVAFIQAANPNAKIVVGGDLNVYPRPDDPFAPIGQPTSSDQLGSLYNPSLGLKNLWEVLLAQAPEAAYSYVYLGMAQTLDQMFINTPQFADLKQFRIAHINSDFPAEYAGDVERGTSDHDPNVAAFVINDPPTVDAGGPYTVNEGSLVTLTASGTDPEGQPLSYAWDLDNNGSFETPGQSVSFNGLDGPATLTVKVQVTDNGGLTAVASATITVNNVAPTATFNVPASANEGVSFSISLINPVDVAADLGSLQYAFDCGSGYAAFGASNSAACTPADSGTLNVGGKVKDKDGGVSEYTRSVTVNNVAPTATFNAPVSVNEGASFNISLTNPVDVAADLGSLQYAFDCGKGYSLWGSTSSAACTAVDNPGVTVKGRLRDIDGGLSEYSAYVIINNLPPVVGTPSATPEPSKEKDKVTARATFSDPGVNDAPFTCSVDYGDGSGPLAGTVSGNTCTGPKHAYTTFGTYTLTVRVTDKDGGTGLNTSQHTVIFDWSGFFLPVLNPPYLSLGKAGDPFPVIFSLGGNKGLNIFAAGYPLSQPINCVTKTALGPGVPTLTASPIGFRDDPLLHLYLYNWKTDKTWKNTCRQLVMKLVDGTQHYANFMFK